MAKKKFKYVVTEENENKKLAVITKKAVDVEFTMQQLDDQEAALRKRITELKAKRDLDAASVENIEHFHPWVKDVVTDDEKLSTLQLYTRSKMTVNQIEPLLAEWEKALDEHVEEVKEIKKQIAYDDSLESEKVG